MKATETLGICESAEQAGVYRFLEEHFYVDYLIDPGIVRDIRVFDPCYVPLLVKRIYKAPNGGRVMKQYHVIGRYIENPTDNFKHEYVKLETVPRGFKFHPRKIHALRTLWAPWPGPDGDAPPSREWVMNMPPAEVAPGRWLVDQLAAVHKFFDVGMELTEKDGELVQTGTVSSTVDRMAQILNAREEADRKIEAEAIAEARYRMRDNWPQMKKAIDEGRLQEPPKEKKLFVDLGASSLPIQSP
jgi:hypothetical protein